MLHVLMPQYWFPCSMHVSFLVLFLQALGIFLASGSFGKPAFEMFWLHLAYPLSS